MGNQERRPIEEKIRAQRKRSERIQVFVTPREKEAIATAANAAGISASQYFLKLHRGFTSTRMTNPKGAALLKAARALLGEVEKILELVGASTTWPEMSTKVDAMRTALKAYDK